MIPIRVTDTRVTSCWNAVIQCFLWFSTMLLPDTSFLLNVIIIHSVLLWMIRACCRCWSALELWGGGFGQNKHFLYIQVPGVDIVVDYNSMIGWYCQPPSDQYTQLIVQEIHSCMMLAFFFFCTILVYFLRMTLSSSLLLVPHIRGHMARTPLPSPLPCLPSSFQSRKKKEFRIRFPSLASPCVELVCIHATYQYTTQHAGCEALSAVSPHTGAFVSGFDLDPNEHIHHFLL